jgi:hypothetical protein
MDQDRIAAMDGYAAYLAKRFFADEGKYNRAWVMQEFTNIRHDDEAAYMVKAMRQRLAAVVADFTERAENLPSR